MDEKVKSKEADPSKPTEQDLQKSLEDSFPASDPSATTQPGGGRKPDEPKT